MKANNIWSSLFLKTAFFILLVFSTTTLSQAQTVTFGQFIQRNGTNDFLFTNNGTGASFQTLAGGTPVLFTYQNVALLPAELQGPQPAHVFVTATTTAPAVQVNTTDPARDIQPFNQTFVIQVIRDTPANSGSNTRRNLLTAIVTPDGSANSVLSGDDQSDAAAYTASTARQNVAYFSDFLGFVPTGSRNFSLSFSSVNPLLAIGAGGFLQSFTAAGTGTFASNPAPVFNPPTAGGVTVSGRVYNAFGSGVSRALVSITDGNGNSISTTTSPLGYFTFEDVRAGQTVTISVTTKAGNYAPQILNLQDNIDSISFHPIDE